jgi:hypothetical protein
VFFYVVESTRVPLAVKAEGRLSKLLRESSGSGMAALNNSDGCRPPQPKFLLCQSLPQTLQSSKFVISIAKDIENSSPTPSSTPIRRQIISALPVIQAGLCTD